MTRVAIVGGGAAGIGASRELLRAGVDVTIVESGPRLGGNCVGVDVTDRFGKKHRVDAGVSDFNRTTFHEVSRLIDELGVPTHPISNDADFVGEDRRSRISSVDGRWTFGREVENPKRLGREIETFRARAAEVLRDPRFSGWTVDRYLRYIGSSEDFRRLYLLPRAMGCFPMPDGNPEQFSILALLRFWNIHGLVASPTAGSQNPPPANRHCVVGGMHRYVAAYAERFKGLGGELLCGHRVSAIERNGRGVELKTVDRWQRERRIRADHVLLACHAQQALPLLQEPSPDERQTLGRFPWQRARLVVHHDERLLGAEREAWGAFNYLVPEGDWPRVRPTITFFPNRLGSLPAEVPDTFVTMNPAREPRPDRVLVDRSFLHPILDVRTDALAREVDALQGQRRTWFAGSYLAAPAVHESALTSGMRAARRLLEQEGQARTFWGHQGTSALRAQSGWRGAA